MRKFTENYFSYEEEQILKDYSIDLPKGKVVGIHGVSGSGKSTLLKLLMRFWDVDSGNILISGKNMKEINTADLREMESYVTQETYLFHDSIANNIAVGKPGASREEIMEAAKKASIHDFIMTLPKGYDTEVGELGDTLSGGEKQRIGIARAFLHDVPFLLLDEPTSNLDSLNEGIILKSLKEARKNKTVILVSHRKSTMNLADVVYEMEPFVSEAEGIAAGKTVALFGSYGWGDGQWMRDWVDRMNGCGANVLNGEGLICHETPDETVLTECEALGKQLASV